MKVRGRGIQTINTSTYEHVIDIRTYKHTRYRGFKRHSVNTQRRCSHQKTMDPPPSKRRKLSLPYKEVFGDVTEEYNSNTAVIVQINNCVSRKVHIHSLCWYISQKYPYGNPYICRKHGPYPNLASMELRPPLGSVKLQFPPKHSTGPIIACCFSQYRMGNTSSSYYQGCKSLDEEYKRKSTYHDTYEHRLEYFRRSLNCLVNKLKNILEIKIIAFPKYIGCGMAGGSWIDYKGIIINFAYHIKSVRPDINVHIVEKKKNKDIN